MDFIQIQRIAKVKISQFNPKHLLSLATFLFGIDAYLRIAIQYHSPYICCLIHHL